MYKTKKEIENLIGSYNPEQVERMKADNYLDHIEDNDSDGFGRFRYGGLGRWNLFSLNHFLIYFLSGKVEIGGKQIFSKIMILKELLNQSKRQ